jgi:hypothetical protein
MMLETSNTVSGNSVTLNTLSVYDMNMNSTGGDTLNIDAVTAATRSYVDIAGDTSPNVTSPFHLTTGIWGVSPTLTYTGIAYGQTVTLNVGEFTAGGNLGSQGSVVVFDPTHPFTAINYFNGTTYTGGAEPDFVIGTGATAQTLNGGGGADVLVGNNSGGNTIEVADSSFSFIDGGTGATANDTLKLLPTTSTPFNIDFTTIPDNVRDIDGINLWTAGTSGIGNIIKLNIQDVFDMTTVADGHTLYISDTAANANGNASATVVADTTSNTGIFHTAGTLTGTPTDITYTGTYNSTTVTLVIENATSTTAGNGGIHVATAPV